MADWIAFHRLPGALTDDRWTGYERSVQATPVFVRRHAGPWTATAFSAHHDWELTVCLRGGGWLEDASGRHPLRSGTFALVPPGTAHRECARSGLDSLWIGWRGRFAADLAQGLHIWESRDLLPLAERLWSTSVRCGGGDGAMLDGLLLAILGGLRRPADGGGDPRLDAIIADLQRSCHHPWTASGLARRAGRSPDAFTRAFRAATGHPPLRYLAVLRCERARALLNDGLAINEVARQVGYADPAYFSRVFRRVTGRAPSRG
jgi:AraC-like DNA-binding protein